MMADDEYVVLSVEDAAAIFIHYHQAFASERVVQEMTKARESRLYDEERFWEAVLREIALRQAANKTWN